MLLVAFLRWLLGYLSFSVEGTFPERFLNIAAKKGLNLWKMRKNQEVLQACARSRDKDLLLMAARQSGNRLENVKQHGLPTLLQRYRHRWGLPAGMVLCGIICQYLSGFVWQIHITVPEEFNEYELRQMLRSHGLYEGVRSSEVDVAGMIHQLSTEDDRISWMTVNLMGTNAEVNLSPRLSAGSSGTKDVVLSNIKSRADGTVTRVYVYNGSAAVKVGDGIHKNQLLVSGLLEYNNGRVVPVDSSARIFARTARRVTLTLPKSAVRLCPTEQTTEKTEGRFFGLSLPLSLQGSVPGDTVRDTQHQQVCLFDSFLPIYVTREVFTAYEKQPVAVTSEQADAILQQKLQLYCFFMLAETKEGRLLHCTTRCREEQEAYVLTAELEIEEDIGEKTVIPYAPEQSLSQKTQDPVTPPPESG